MDSITKNRKQDQDWIQRVWNETQIRASRWSRKHHRGISPEYWNTLWERVHDELYGVAWACERRRTFATAANHGEGVAI